MIVLGTFTTTGAWADADLVQTAGAATFASDLFGEGSTGVTLNPDGGATVDLLVDDPVGTDGIGDGNIADLTFTLVNGTFAGLVPLSSIEVTGGVAAFTRTDGGAAGDSSVTFQVEIVTTVPEGQSIVFTLPPLTGVSISDTDDVVLVAASIVPTTTAPQPFPNDIDGADCDNPLDCIVLNSSDPYDDFTMGSGETGLVDIDDRPIIFDVDGPGAPTTVDVDGDGTLRDGIVIGTHELDLKTVGLPLQRDGSPFSITVGGDGVGAVTLTVLGNFRDGDIVFADVPGGTADTVDPGEAFTITGSTATLAGLPTTAVEGIDIPVLYVPNETDDLAPEVFTTTARIDYVLATNVVRAADLQTVPGAVEFDGIDVEGYAYGVVREGGVDRSFVRVTNESSSPVAVFFSCSDDAGNPSFGDFGIIGGNETEAFDSNELGAVLGTFTGRGACDILSDGNLSVQHKIRSSDILTDNSVVIGRDINPD